jgi:hypothetical protein
VALQGRQRGIVDTGRIEIEISLKNPKINGSPFRNSPRRLNPETACRLHLARNGTPFLAITGIMDRSVCREALQEMVSMCPPDLTQMKFGSDFEWVVEALEQLDARFPPLLSAEDAKALLHV